MISFGGQNDIEQFLKKDYENNQSIIEKFIGKDGDDSEDWLMMFLVIRMMQLKDCEDEQDWCDFQNEILHNNRFFPKSHFLERVEELSPHLTLYIDAGETLFRCREYGNDCFYNNYFVDNLMNLAIEELPELALKKSDFRNGKKVETIFASLMLKPGIKEKVIEKYTNAVNELKMFWGYDASGSDAPPEPKTKSMRANPEGIRYLYASETIETALSEMRPQMGQTYSVATIKITEKTKIFDFTQQHDPDVFVIDNALFNREILDYIFSNPNYGDPLAYVPTQCICEFIKLLGFDGIRFHSSLAHGNNIVLFNVCDNKKYEIVASEVYMVGNIKIDYSKVFPLDENVKKQWKLLLQD